MNYRILKLQMTKGAATLVETKDIPLKDNHLLQTHDMIFYCNSVTMDKVAEIEHSGIADSKRANKRLETFFIRDAKAANIIPSCKQFVQQSQLKIVKN